ncbi:MAG: FxLYD domain-containing protein [Coriobacteriia bacterium]
MELGKYFDGRPLTYDESTGTFRVGEAAVSAEQVRGYAAAAQITWANPDMAFWFGRSFPGSAVPSPAQPAAGAAPATPAAAPSATAPQPMPPGQSQYTPQGYPTQRQYQPAAPPPKKSKVGIIIAVIAVVLVLCSCVAIVANSPSSNTQPGTSTGTGSTSPANPGAAAPAAKKGLVVTESSFLAGEYGIRYVTGTVVNNSDKNYGYVQVAINLYDAQGAQVGSTMANINNLAPGGTWKFKAPILEEACTSFKVKDVTGF